jgi:hypothetical protein
MKKILNGLGFILICSILVLATGCNNKKLSEGKAETAIKNLLQKEPDRRTMTIPEVWFHAFFGDIVATPEHDKDRPKYLELEKRGLLKVTYEQVYETPAHPGWHNGVYRRISLTDKSKKYLIKATPASEGQDFEILLGERIFLKITGITEPSDSMGMKMCQVNFETKWDLTPFGEVFADSKNNIEEHSVPFVLYSDGWRLGM